jgi:hypothetical protein
MWCKLRVVVLSTVRRIISLYDPAMHEDAWVQSNRGRTLICAELCAFLCGGILSLRRGGIVKGPLMLELGVLPDVSLSAAWCCLAQQPLPAAVAAVQVPAAHAFSCNGSMVCCITPASTTLVAAV